MTRSKHSSDQDSATFTSLSHVVKSGSTIYVQLAGLLEQLDVLLKSQENQATNADVNSEKKHEGKKCALTFHDFRHTLLTQLDDLA